MSDFVTGDPIQVQARRFAPDVWEDRTFLAEYSGRVHYLRGTEAFDVPVTRVRAPQAKPLAVGDSAQLDGKGVKIVAGPFTGYSQWYAVRDAGDDKTYPCPAADLSRPAAPQAATFAYKGVTYRLDKKYRAATSYEGERLVWSFTGRRDEHGVPRVTCYGNTMNNDTISAIADRHGPLTEADYRRA